MGAKEQNKNEEEERKKCLNLISRKKRNLLKVGKIIYFFLSLIFNLKILLKRERERERKVELNNNNNNSNNNKE
jgi:hypothetical protein